MTFIKPKKFAYGRSSKTKTGVKKFNSFNFCSNFTLFFWAAAQNEHTKKMWKIIFESQA